MAGIDSHLSDILTHAPELVQHPGLTLGLAQGLSATGAPVDSGAVGQAASLALAGQGLQQAHEDVKSVHHSGWFDSVGSFFGHIGHDIKNDVLKPVVRDVASPGLNLLNKPLSEIQHTYRYLHDVWERHGVVAVMGEMLNVEQNPAGIGQMETNRIAGVKRNLAGVGYGDSWDATAHGEMYRDRQGWHVSPGRDLTRLIGYVTRTPVQENAAGTHVKGAWWANLTSGTTDAAFDLTLDPTLKVGKLLQDAKRVKYAPRLYKSWEDFQGGEHLARRSLVDEANIQPNNVQVIYNSQPAVRSEFDRIAKMTTAQVLTSHPMLYPMAKALGAAKTGQEVADAFESALTARNYSFMRYGVPHTSLTRRTMSRLGVQNPPTVNAMSARVQSTFARVAKDPNDPTQPLMSSVTGMPIMVPHGALGHTINAFTSYMPFAFNSKTLAISAHAGDPMDPEVLRGLYATIGHSQAASTSKAILARYVEADDLAEKASILSNAYRDALRASGLPDEAPFAGQVAGDINFKVKQALGSIYGIDKDGRAIRLVDDNGNVMSRGLLANQTGQVVFPDFNEWRKAIAESKGTLWGKLSHADDFLHRHITTRFFKRLVLLSLGFALRVSSGELIPGMMSTDVHRVVGSSLASASAKLNPDHSGLFRDLSPEMKQGLIGSRVTTPGVRHIGVVKDIDHDTGEAIVRLDGEDVTVPVKQLTFYHADIDTEEIAKAVQEYGARITGGEVGHIRAAAGKALYGVSRALVDSDYRDVALMNILANDGHIVAPGLSSAHDLPRGYQGINGATREAALHAGINIPKNQAMGKAFRMWDSGDQNHPLFWKFAIDEAAGDNGVRAIARSMASTLGATGGHDWEAIAAKMREGGVTYDPRTKTFVEKGYSVAHHPGLEKTSTDDFQPEHLQKYFQENFHHVAKPGHALGGWYDRDTGEFGLDVAELTNDEAKAKRLALRRGEKAYGDLAAYSRGEDGTRYVNHPSDELRLRRRADYAAGHPLPAVRSRSEAVVSDHRPPAGRGDQADAGGEGSGSPAEAGADQVRRFRESDTQVADEIAVKADREWFESSDSQAVRARREMAGYFNDPDNYSAKRVELVKGLVYGQNGHINLDVLQALARGESPTIAELAAKDFAHRPIAVKGRTMDAIPQLGAIDRIIGGAWHPIHGIINSLSRAPLWTTYVTEEYKMFKPWVEAGLMSKAEAHSIAQVRSLNRMLPNIHNTLLRSKMSLVFRNVFPFYFAQEQAYKRYGKAVFANPKAFREAQLFLHGLHSSGALQQDDQGNTHIVFPGVGEIPFLLTLGASHLGLTPLGGVPATVAGDTVSLRSVVPEAVGPGVGPVVAVPMKELGKLFPATDPYVSDLLGTFGGPAAANASLKDEMIPNATARRVWEALDSDDKNRVFGSTVSYNIAWATHKALPLWEQAEKIDPRSMDPSIPRDQLNPKAAALLAKADRLMPLPNADPKARQVAMDRIRNATHVQLMFKALFGFASPLAPVMSVGDVELQPELRKLMSKYGAAEGIQRFTDRHPDATPDTVFQSNNSETGTNPPATAAALDWVSSNRGWVDHNELAAAYLIPQSKGDFSSAAYNLELATHLRQRRTPEQFLDAVYTAVGNAEFIPALKDYQAQKAAAEQAGDSATVTALGQQWQGYFADLQNRNPVWYANEFSATKKSTAITAYQQLEHAINDKHTPDSPMLPVVRQLVADYKSYQQQLSLAQSGTGTYTKTQLQQQWKDYLDSVVTQNPQAQALVYGVFRRLGAS